MTLSANSTKSSVIAGVMTIAFIMSSPARAQDKIYVDSVPAGASVYALPQTDGESGQRLLGKTPLALDASAAPSMRFWFMINMDRYLAEIERIPKLRDWASKIGSDRFPGTYIPKYFDFEFSSTQGAKSRDGKIVGLGPVVTLDFPKQNRLVVIFLPEGEKVSALFPIMPPRGTFRFDEVGQKQLLVSKYGVPDSDACEAIEALSRCGKARVLVTDSPAKGYTRELIITIQGPDTPLVMVTENLRKK